LLQYVEYGKNSQEPPSRVTDLAGASSNTISQGSFMPNSLNAFKAQSITTTTATTTVSSSSSKLTTTNAVLPSRVSKNLLLIKLHSLHFVNNVFLAINCKHNKH